MNFKITIMYNFFYFILFNKIKYFFFLNTVFISSNENIFDLNNEHVLWF